jgi:hypothetical protein
MLRIIVAAETIAMFAMPCSVGTVVRVSGPIEV